MLKVPNVDETVDYWTQTHGAQIRISRPVSKNEDNTNTDTPMTTHADGSKPARLASAFVELGNAVTSQQEDPQTTKNPITSFALEIVRTKISKDAYSIGNCVSYIGMSMLLTYQMTQPDGLLNVIRSAKTPPPGVELPPPQPDQEINGIPIQSVASAPGDYFARLALSTKQLEATADFYTTVLGMNIKAQDDTTLCLRYEPEIRNGDDNDNNNDPLVQFNGIPTTLVFDLLEDAALDMGDCFDHLAILTYAPIDPLYERIQESKNLPTNIFMKPTDMFGKRVMGLMDPNGYKIVLASI